MHYHQNHSWCYNSHWDDKIFHTRHMVGVDRQIRIKEYDSFNDTDIDWNNLIIQDKAVNKEQRKFLEDMKDNHEIGESTSKWTDELLDKMSLREYPSLKPEVMKWLEDNVLPPKSKRDFDEQPYGWCIGNVDYRLTGSGNGLTIWFYRRNDAMKFIKEWSFYKRPTTYLNYFNDDWREMDFETGKLVKKER